MISVSLRRAALAALISLCAVPAIEAGPVLLAEYNFDNSATPGAASYADPSLTATNFIGGAGTSFTGGYFDFGTTMSNTEATAPNGSFGVAVNPPATSLLLDRLTFDGRYTGAAAQGTLLLRIVAATFTEDVLVNFGSETAFQGFILDLSTVPAIVGDTFKLSILDHNSGKPANVAIDNVRLYGSVVEPSNHTAVPEPASLALMGLGGIGMIGGAIRKRRKATIAA